MDIATLVSQIAKTAEQGKTARLNAVSKKNLEDPVEMLKVQFAVQQYSSMINLSSALLDAEKKIIAGIISKI